jgi:hypothetical protein
MNLTRPTFRLALLLVCPFAADAKPLSDKVVEQAASRIDRLLSADLKKAGLKENQRIDDATFLRRSYLGIIGRIPSEAEARQFLENPASDRRDKLIDDLVSSPGFDSHLFNWTADLLRLQTKQEQFGLGWHVWLRKSVAEDKPWNTMISEMLGSSGHCSTDPAVGYYLRDRNMQLDNFSNTMSVFLGRQIGCAQCHDHPFDDWSQYDYYQMAAFGGGIEYRSSEAQEFVRKTTMALAPPELKSTSTISTTRKDPAYKQQVKEQLREKQRFEKNLSNQFRPLFKDFNKNAIVDDKSSALRLPEDYKYKDAKPGDAVPVATLFGEKIVDVEPENRKTAFASWVTSPNNPYFTKVIANRLWARTFGHGLVDPVDDWRDDSATVHPELLAFLETMMKGANYDMRQFLRILYHTQLFQRECLTEEPSMGVPPVFQGPVLTRMSAEQLFDSFLVLTRAKVDDKSSPAFTKSWDTYCNQVSGLLNVEPHELLVLAESAKQGEALQRAAQSDQRAAQKAMADAKTPEEKVKARADFDKARTRDRDAREQADPLSSMQMGMMDMMGGQDRKGASGLRASELAAPFKPGSLVREFGGSDRQTPSSSVATATVPQALALLNDYKTDIVSGKKSRLGQVLSQIDSPEKRLDCLFITLFSEFPSEKEKQKYSDLAKNPVALRDLTRAMLTSNRFLFIQ